MIRLKPLLVSLAVSLGTGVLSGLLISNTAKELYGSLNLPAFAPPAWVFSVVWFLLYVLMGISAYLVWESNSKLKKPALIVYGLQLLVQFVWPILFFICGQYLFAFIWLALLWALLAVMLVLFYRCRPAAAYLQIPYFIWVTFAGYLNFMVYLLNR